MYAPPAIDEDIKDVQLVSNSLIPTQVIQSSVITSAPAPPSSAKRGRKRKQKDITADEPIKETNPRRKSTASTPRSSTKALNPPTHVNPPSSSQKAYQSSGSRSNLQSEIMKITPRPLNQPQMISTVKLVKSEFYESIPNKLPLHVPEIPINEQIKWPDVSVLSKADKELFKIWNVEDDYLLVTSYSYLENVKTMFCECEFSQLFYSFEIEERLHFYYNDPIRGDLMRQRINQMDSQTRMKLNSKIPFSEEALAALCNIPSYDDLNVSYFVDLLLCEQLLFGYTRTPEELKAKWEILRNQNKLKDQQDDYEKKDESKDDHLSTFSKDFPQAESYETITSNLNKFFSTVDENDDAFLPKFHKHFDDHKLEFSHPDFALPYPEGISSEDDCQHIASLRYNNFVYTIEMPSTIIGCCNSSFEPTVDLKVLGESERIASKQAVIEYDESKQFYLKNLGKFPLFVNGTMVIPEGKEILLPSRCVIKFDRISMVFRISKRSISKVVLDWNLIKISE